MSSAFINDCGANALCFFPWLQALPWEGQQQRMANSSHAKPRQTQLRPADLHAAMRFGNRAQHRIPPACGPELSIKSNLKRSKIDEIDTPISPVALIRFAGSFSPSVVSKPSAVFWTVRVKWFSDRPAGWFRCSASFSSLTYGHEHGKRQILISPQRGRCRFSSLIQHYRMRRPNRTHMKVDGYPRAPRRVVPDAACVGAL